MTELFTDIYNCLQCKVKFEDPDFSGRQDTYQILTLNGKSYNSF